MRHADGQSFSGFDNRPCVEFHASASCEKSIKGVADAVIAGNRLAADNKNRAGLVQRQYRFDIPGIEGVFEKGVNLPWRECGHWLD